MIVFVPTHDEPTQFNRAVWERVVRSGCVELLGEEAIQERLLAAVQEVDEPLFAMSHGTSEALLGQNKCIGICRSDLAPLTGRAVFAFACLTARRLGQFAAQGSVTWWGYINVVIVTDVIEELLPVYAKVFQFIFDNFAVMSDPEASHAFLDRLKGLCEEGGEFIQTHLAETDEDLFSPLVCMRNIWALLRVWHAGSTECRKHPEAPEPYFQFL